MPGTGSAFSQGRPHCRDERSCSYSRRAWPVLCFVGQAATYGSDFKDGANLKGLAASFFLFFACLAPAVAFGGLLGKATQGQVRRRHESSRGHVDAVVPMGGGVLRDGISTSNLPFRQPPRYSSALPLWLANVWIRWARWR